MDYLLLYAPYHQLVPPHIAAGINLNFLAGRADFPPSGGVLFIRRTFKGNKLYSTVFREYLGELFSQVIPSSISGRRSFLYGAFADPKLGSTRHR